ncbi:restriction endonuclease subunit S [Microbulbifer marinus]|uniref:Type I restriction enzyme, S subunit n=1 Tax=Microbulbifer marinus TaxID=658218 RepID=A0A1H3WFQ2_9GAMM|nr:restriction endonuclease subunit S [Microbulbifer marinus]SDZ85966.1 type I restriction enzyme, S subunit [Microbulbifer marinus]
MSYTIPANWDRITLGELTQSTRPICYGVLKPGENVEGGTPLVRITDITGNYFDDSSLYHISDELDKEFSRSKLKGGEILVSIQGTIGRVAICPLKYRGANISRTIAVIDPDPRIDKKYLYWFLRYYGERELFDAFGATRASLNISTLRALEVPLPSLKEQQRIAAILDKADAIRRKRQQAIALADEFLRAVFLDMFGDPVTNPKGWPVGNIKSLSKRFSDGPFGSKLKSEHYEESGVRVIRLQNIGIDEFKDTDRAYVSEEYFRASLSKFECRAGDIVIGTLGEPNVRACLIPEHIETAINKADCVHCIPDETKVSKGYLVSLLNLPQFLHFFTGLLHGQTRTRVSSGQLGRLGIPVPSLTLQKEFSDFRGRIEAIKDKITISDLEANSAFESLSQKAFSGQL